MKKLLFVFFLITYIYSNAQTTKFGGVYVREYKKYKDTTGVIDLYPENDSTILFYVEDWRKMDYNSGSITGRLTIGSKDSSVFYLDTSIGFKCRLTFKFNSNKLLISSTDDNDYCGYGYGVSPDGIYFLSNKKIPLYYINRHGTKIYFTKLINLPQDSLLHY